MVRDLAAAAASLSAAVERLTAERDYWRAIAEGRPAPASRLAVEPDPRGINVVRFPGAKA